MNLPLSSHSTRRFQSIILRVGFTDSLARSPLAVPVFCDLVQQLMLKIGIGGIVVDQCQDVVLAMEGTESELDDAVAALRISRYADIEIAWRSQITQPRYRRLSLVRPALTPGEREWLGMEIRTGFSNLATLPTLLDWLAIRQANPGPTLESEGLLRRARPGNQPRAEVL